MDNATLGLELEYDNTKAGVILKVGEATISEEDFKSKHIIISSEAESQQATKTLFSEFGEYGISITLDTKSGHGQITGDVALTFELVLDHNKFKIDRSYENLIEKPFAGKISDFTEFLKNQDRETTFNIKFDTSVDSPEFTLEIPKMSFADISLMPHVTIPCPTERVKIMFPEYLFRLIISLKGGSVTGALNNTERNRLAKHDPKQGYPIIPKTSLGSIFLRNKDEFQFIKSQEYSIKNDYYITCDLTFNTFMDSIQTMIDANSYIQNEDKLFRDLIGIGSIGDKFETINGMECPIWEFRSIRNVNASEITVFETKLKDELLKLYIPDAIPFL